MKDLYVTGDGSPMDNIAFMESNADEILPGYEYSRELSDDEIENERVEFANVSIKIEQLLEEKERFMAEFNERLKVQKQLAKKSLRLIRIGRMDVVETVYLVKDENEGMVGTYNQNGVLLSERKMKGTERQRTIYTRENVAYKSDKTGTDD